MKALVLGLALAAATSAQAADGPKEGERGTMKVAAMGHSDQFAFAKARMLRGFSGNKEANEFEEMHAFKYIRPGTDVLVERAPGDYATCVRPEGAKECLWVESDKVGPLYVAGKDAALDAPMLTDAQIEALSR